jgi:hypothetical protein
MYTVGLKGLDGLAEGGREGGGGVYMYNMRVYM